MRRTIAFGSAFFCLALLVGALELQAAPPVNDQCFGAEIIDTTGPSPWLSSITTNMHESTAVGDPPAPANCYGGTISSNSIWYAFTPPVSGLYTISTKFTATTMDSLMGIYTSPNGCSGPFTQYACNDDVGNLQSAVSTNFNAGTTYYVVIWHTVPIPLDESERSVQLKVAPVLPAPNDSCGNAQVIPSSASFPYWTATVDTHLANTDGDPPAPVCIGSNISNTWRSVWFKFRPASGGSYIIATCMTNTATKIDSTVLGIYENTGGCGGTFTQLRCNDGFCGKSAAVIMNLTPQTDYYIAVWDVDREPSPDETDVQLLVERQGPPSVTTVGHSNAQPTTVTLIGAANPKGSSTRGYFEWGTTPAYGNVTANSSPHSEIYNFVFSRAVTDLTPGRTVYYRAVAFNFFGTVYGEGRSVTLPFPPPDITSITRQGNGVRIQFTGMEGYTHEVQVSEDLRNWTRLGDATPLEFDQFEYVDPGPLNRPQRFYRIRLLIN